MPHNCRQMRQSYGRGNCVVIGNRYHQKRVYPAIGEISMYLRIFFKNFYAFPVMPGAHARRGRGAQLSARITLRNRRGSGDLNTCGPSRAGKIRERLLA